MIECMRNAACEHMTLDEQISFCEEKSKNIKLKAEPQTFVDIKNSLEKLKELRGKKMEKFLESVIERDFDRRISEVVKMLERKQLFGTISLIKDLKYYLDLATKEKTRTCNCQQNRNSRDNEPCCRCDSRQTNADRIRNMSDEEMAERIASSSNFNCADYCDSFTKGCDFNCGKKGREIALKWLQSEAE